jgi:hypothetical protein
MSPELGVLLFLILIYLHKHFYLWKGLALSMTI